MAKNAQPGDLLLVVHEFIARSSDELSLAKGDKIELLERDDDFGDGWFLGRHVQNGQEGLFPEVYTTLAPKPTLSSALQQHRSSLQALASKTTPSNDSGARTPPGSISTPQTNGLSTPAESSIAPSSLDVTPEQPTMDRSPQPSIASTNRTTSQSSAVMNETLSVIEEHITDMNKPAAAMAAHERRHSGDSTSQYSGMGDNQVSYIPGDETDEEEGTRLTKSEVLAWTSARAASYLREQGVEALHCKVFQEQEFTGEVLLEMDQSSIFLKELELGPVGRRLRTWQKIKALQDEVKPRKPAVVRKPLGTTSPSETSRQSTPLSGGGTTLPRIPQHNDSSVESGSESLRDKFGNQSLGGRSDTDLVPPSPSAGMTGSRPSAASVRNLSHSRRHSSIDQTLRDSPDPTSHAKQASFDRNWTMGGGQTTANGTLRPASAVHTGSYSTDRALLESPVIPTESDRGYSSGGEMDVRKQRKLQRKRDSQDHSRQNSYTSEKRLSTNIFTRNMHSSSPSKSIDTNRLSAQDGTRVVSEPVAERTSPTVTKLDYDNDSRMSRSSGSKTTLVENQSPAPTSSDSRQGLRATSDAVTSREKNMLTLPQNSASPVDGSGFTQSPTQTESSLPSATTKSAEADEFNKPELMTAATGMQGSGTRRKTKKATSAYIRGLEKKTPQEQIEGCDYSGWMKKKSSNLMTTWKPRLFVLRGRRLSYYYSEDDTEEKGLIDISNHRVLPADNDILTNMLAGITGANSPHSPQKSTSPNSPATSEQKSPISTTSESPNSPMKSMPGLSPSVAQATNTNSKSGSDDQTFIFKLLPPRSGLSKAVNFTKPTVHYFAVPNIIEGRLWMAAMMKATIDRDETAKVRTTYQQKTISLEKARARKERPPFLGGVEEDPDKGEETTEEAKVLSVDGIKGDFGDSTDSPLTYEPNLDPMALPTPGVANEKDAQAGVTQAVTNLEPPGSAETTKQTPPTTNGGRRWTLGSRRDSARTRTERSGSEPGKGLGIQMEE